MMTNFKQIFDFLSKLQVHNDRNWFNEHKDEYMAAHREFAGFVNALIVPLSQLDESIGTVSAEECIFRIYRDVRFSHDKSPYKTNFGAFIAKGGKKAERAGYYVHIQPDESMLSGGIYMPAPETLEAVRNEIYHHPQEIRKILENKSFKKYFGTLSEEDKLKNPPKGYPKDFQEIDLLKNKHFVTGYPVPNDFFMKDHLIGRIMEIFKAQYPLNAFINRALDK
jgi:uncharacterized protein (TIGR02453 family)